jgi:hypothetical protein
MKPGLAVALLLVATLCEADDRAPVLVVVKENIGAGSTVRTPGAENPIASGLVFNLIGAWANSSVNKDSAIRVARFHEVIAQPGIAAELVAAMGCHAAPADCVDGAAMVDATEFTAALDRRTGRDGVILEITPELDPDQFLLRVVAYQVAMGKKELERRAQRTALFTMRVPPELAARVKKSPDEVLAYWSAGDPRRLLVETRRGAAMIHDLFGKLGAAPDAELAKLKEFKASGRIACSGPAWCSQARVLEDRGDGFVLVVQDSVIGYLDAHAAAKQANLLLYASLGLAGN